MLSVLSKTRTIVSVDLSDDTITKAAVVSTNGERFLIEEWDFYSENNDSNADFIQSYKPEAITVVLGDAHTLCFAAPELNSYNLEMEKRKRGVAIDTQYSDYLNISRSGMLASIHRDTAQEIISSVKDTFPGISRLTINQSMVALLYLYLRSYQPQPEIRTALLHCAGQQVSLLVVQTEMPVWQGSIEIKLGDKEAIYSEISALLQTASDKIGDQGYDLLLLIGDCDETDVREMSNFARRVELFSPFHHNAFELGRMPNQKRKDTQLHGHRLAVAIGAAGMLLEGVGINLGGTAIELEHELPLQRISYKEHTQISLVLNNVMQVLQRVISLLFLQRKIIIIGLLAAVLIVSYRFISDWRIGAELDQQLAQEEVRSRELADIRTKFEDYNNKIATLNDRANAIGEIRKRQLTIKTVFDELDQRIPAGVVISELDIKDTNVKIKGYTTEVPAAVAFANRLGQSIGVFADVVPVYEDRTSANIGKYEISCKYIGRIAVNPMPTPAVTANSTVIKEQ